MRRDRTEYLKQWRKDHKEYHRDYMRLWTKKNPDNVIRHNKNSGVKRIAFKGKRLLLKEDPRIGICQLCGAVRGMDCKKTHMHHIKYHPDDPLKDTIEVCGKCHRRQHKIWSST